MQVKQLNDPSSGVDEKFIEFINGNASVKMNHGDAIVRDMTTNAIMKTVTAIHTTTEQDNHVLGVVFDPSGNGVEAGERGVAMVRGYHPAVKIESAVTTTTTIGMPLATWTSAGFTCTITAASTFTGSVGGSRAIVGYIAESPTSGVVTAAVYVDIG